MPPLATEAQILALYPIDPQLSRAGWLDAYALHRGALTPGMSLGDAYEAAIGAHATAGLVNPRLAAMCDAIAADLPA